MSQLIMKILVYSFLAADVFVFGFSVFSVLRNALSREFDEDDRRINSESFFIERDITFTNAQGYIE